jgi:hypothetical protein
MKIYCDMLSISIRTIPLWDIQQSKSKAKQVKERGEAKGIKAK